MKIADYIKSTIDASGRRELELAMLMACSAVDGTAKKLYPNMKVGERFRKFITDHLDIIELMFGGTDLKETIFPFKNIKGQVGVKFEDMVYETFRCNLAHGDELPDGYGLCLKVAEGIQQFEIDLAGRSMKLPESVIYAISFPCVLSPVNADQKIGSYSYYYHDPINHFTVDRWWGKIECARQIMDFDNQIRIKMDFSNYIP